MLAARAAAAAYCSRVLVSRGRESLRHAFGGWLEASLRVEMTDRVYEVEERTRQQLMTQARTFQARLTYSLTYLLTCLLTYLLTYLRTYLLTYLLTY